MLKTKKFRRLLAGLLAVLMLSVCLPVGAFADDGNDASAASASTTRVTFQFTDGEAFSESVLGSGFILLARPMPPTISLLQCRKASSSKIRTLPSP